METATPVEDEPDQWAPATRKKGQTDSVIQTPFAPNTLDPDKADDGAGGGGRGGGKKKKVGGGNRWVRISVFFGRFLWFYLCCIFTHQSFVAVLFPILCLPSCMCRALIHSPLPLLFFVSRLYVFGSGTTLTTMTPILCISILSCLFATSSSQERFLMSLGTPTGRAEGMQNRCNSWSRRTQ